MSYIFKMKNSMDAWKWRNHYSANIPMLSKLFISGEDGSILLITGHLSPMR